MGHIPLSQYEPLFALAGDWGERALYSEEEVNEE